MQSYSELAKGFLSGNWPVDCCLKNVGYSSFLAVIYFIFGVENIGMVRIVNILLDLGTAYLIYIIGRDVYNKKVGMAAFIIYILNPLTSSYTGLVLAESVTVFYIAFIGFIITRKKFKENILLWFLTGISLGILLFTKHAFYYFSLGFIFILAIFYFKNLERFKFIAVALLGFLIASSYSIWGYYTNFRVISLVPPYPMTSGILYASFYLERYPEVIYNGVAWEYTKMALDYAATPLGEKNKFSQKYSALFWQKMKTDWPVFMRNYFRNMYWMWDKEHLYTYVDPFYPMDKWPIRMANIALLSFSLLGFTGVIVKKGRAVLKEPLFLFSLSLFFYMSLLFPLVTNETRHTLPFYPLLFIWSVAGIEVLSFLKPLKNLNV